MTRKVKRLSKAEFTARFSAPIDTDVYADKWGEEARVVAESCRWLDRAARLYGMRRIVALLRCLERPDGELWVSYWRRWRARNDRQIIPFGVICEPYAAQDRLAPGLVFAARQAAAGRAA